MKLIRSILLTITILATVSCDVDLQEDPNAINVDEMNPTLLLNNIQTSFANFFNASSTFGMQVTRMQNSGGADYENYARPTGYNNVWTTAYAGIMNDVHTLIPIAEANGLTRHLGIARTLEAYVLLTLVDYFGDVPYSQAFQGLGNPNPAPDDMQELYTKAIGLLDQALVDFGTAPNPSGAAVFDYYYGGDATKWIRLVNSLKLKVYLNLRGSDPSGSTTAIAALIAHPGGFISAQNQNFVFRYSTSTADPDGRHPRWTNNWLTGGNDYIANYIMWQMNWGYNMVDPRMRFYFYRQRTANSSNPNEIRCVLEQVPSHYPKLAGGSVVPGPGGMPPGIDPSPANGAWNRTFCFPTGAGYWGRDHVDPQGIPPDGTLRTVWGAYPVGGRFDADNALSVTSATTLANSMRGAGIQPIMMRSFVDFMLAEASLYLSVTPPAPATTAAARFEAGIRNSFADVRDWAVNGTYGSNSFGPSPTQSATINAFAGYDAAGYNANVETYVAAALLNFNAGASNDEKMNYVAREYWISLFGNGIESYNLYRRTGMPTGMQPAISPTPGPFPRSFWYPVVYEARNGTADQKTNLTGRIFWDKGMTNLDF